MALRKGRSMLIRSAAAVATGAGAGGRTHTVPTCFKTNTSCLPVCLFACLPLGPAHRAYCITIKRQPARCRCQKVISLPAQAASLRLDARSKQQQQQQQQTEAAIRLAALALALALGVTDEAVALTDLQPLAGGRGQTGSHYSESI